MRIRFRTRSLFVFTTIVAVAIAYLLPTIRATAFVDSFLYQSSNRTLHWLAPSLRDKVHEQTAANGLTTIGCAGYQPVLEPINVSDALCFRRRIRLQHRGAWDPIDPEAAKAKFLEWIENDLASDPQRSTDIIVSLGLLGATVIEN